MARWFTADLHLGHHNIIGYCQRPYRTAEEMDDDLIARWNQNVDPGDEVWILGDVALGKIVLTLPRIAECHGTKHLVAGNHDRIWGGHRKVSGAARALYVELFATIQDEAALTLNDGTVVRLHHFPYWGDSGPEPRHVEHRPRDDGRWLLHGHIHNLRLHALRQINVGVDMWAFAPVSETAIVKLIADHGGHRTGAPTAVPTPTHPTA